MRGYMMTASTDNKAGRAARGEYLIQGAYVLSVDGAVGDLREGDIHVRDGVIVAVAPHVEAPAAELIDGRRCIAMPGFVDVHWHMWNSIWRGLAHDAVQYFGLHRLATSYTAQDHYDAVRYAALEAVNAGITTCHNWAHALRDADDAEAEMQALVDTGIRARFGQGDSFPIVQTALGADDLRRSLDWIERNGDGRLSLGIAIHHPTAFAEEIATARATWVADRHARRLLTTPRPPRAGRTVHARCWCLAPGHRPRGQHRHEGRAVPDH